MKVKFYTARDGTPYRCIYDSKNRLHNINGPAVVFDDGYTEYWIDGEMITEAKFKLREKKVFDYSSNVIDNGDSLTF